MRLRTQTLDPEPPIGVSASNHREGRAAMSDQPLRLVTVDEARAWMKVFHDADDEQIDYAIIAASVAVTDYLDLTFSWDSNDELVFLHGTTVVVLGYVEKIATLLLVRRLYEGDMGALSYGRLPDDVTALLYVRRLNLGLN